MSLTLSPQIKILALVGLLAALGLGASMMVFGGSASKKPVTPVTTSQAQTHAAATTAVKSHPTPAVPVKPSHTKVQAPAKHVAKPHAVRHAKPARHPGFRGNPVYANLPPALQWELAHHKVVIVSFYNPSSNVDSISVAEAHQAATDAKVGFLLVSVLDDKVAGILTALLPGGGLLPDPGVLVYRAPGDVALRLDGFADRASVAQAALNALHGETGPAPVDSSAADAAAAAAAAAASSAPIVTP